MTTQSRWAEKLKTENTTHQGTPKASITLVIEQRVLLSWASKGFLPRSHVRLTEHALSELGAPGRGTEGCRLSVHMETAAGQKPAACEASSEPTNSSGHFQIHPLPSPVAAGNRTLLKGPPAPCSHAGLGGSDSFRSRDCQAPARQGLRDPGEAPGGGMTG